MKCLERNKTIFYYSLYAGKEPLVDEYGNETGEYRVMYSKPVRMRANISPAHGGVQTEQFGSSLKYDKVIVMDNPGCPIDENSVLFVGVKPQYAADGTPQYNYIVKKAARSLNSLSVAISEADVS